MRKDQAIELSHAKTDKGLDDAPEAPGYKDQTRIAAADSNTVA